MGWKVVGRAGMDYRFNTPSAAARRMISERAGHLARAADPPFSILLSISDRTSSINGSDESSTGPRSDGEVEIKISTRPNPAEFADMNRSVDDRIRPRRNERYFDWRFAKPSVDYTFYIASRGGDPEAVLITRTGSSDNATVLSVVDAVSTRSALTEELTDIWHRLLGSVVRRNEDVDAFRMFTGTVPGKVTRRYGFLTTPRLPFHWYRAVRSYWLYRCSPRVSRSHGSAYLKSITGTSF